MNTSHTTRTAVCASVLTAALTALLFSAAPAHADSEDDFLAALQDAGIMVSDTNSAPTLAKAHAICASLNHGTPAAQLAKGTDPQTRAEFVHIAVHYLCPSHEKDL